MTTAPTPGLAGRGPAPPAHRTHCYRCFRPEEHCLCPHVVAVKNEMPVLILQHAREARHRFGTARLAALALSRCELLVDRTGTLPRDASLADRLRGFGLLYPHPRARDISTLPAEERPKGLVVIDGTWHQARAMYRDIEALHALPHYTLPEGLESGFRIREQPQPHCLSTLEAIAHALEALEPGRGSLAALLRPFEAMQSTQLAAMVGGARRARRPRRLRESRAIPRAMLEDYQRLVVAYGECLTPPGAGRERRLVTCAAARPAGGEAFRAVLRVDEVLPRHLLHMQLRCSEVESGLSGREFRDAFRRFVRPGDVVAAWNQSTLALLQSELPRSQRTVLLKAAYSNLQRHRGSLEAILQLEGLAPEPGDPPDRTAQRLGNALSLARFLHECARGNAPRDPLRH